MCDHSGSPIAVFDGSEGLVKSVDYTVYGEVITDTDPAIHTFLGYQVCVITCAHMLCRTQHKVFKIVLTVLSKLSYCSNNDFNKKV